LEFLSSCHNGETVIGVARGKFQDIEEPEWNLMINFLHIKMDMIDINYMYGEPESIRITYKGMEYLREKKLAGKN